MSEKEILTSLTNFDILISHAPNLRNHYRLLLTKFSHLSKKLVLVFHGYEVLNLERRIFSQKTLFPFKANKNLLFRIYHLVKLPLTILALKILSKNFDCRYVFVSNSLLQEVKKDLRTKLFDKKDKTTIIHNPINKLFLAKLYKENKNGKYICIRPFDDSKYGVDLYLALARNNPQQTFHLYGKGFLPADQVPNNVVIIEKFLKPEELISTFNEYEAIILPTRWDSQGVLACEAAEFGMPLITSKIPACIEMLENFENVYLIDNADFPKTNVSSLINHPRTNKVKKFTNDNTVGKEVELFRSILKL